MAVMDILIKATDKASDVMEGVGKKGGSVAQTLEKNWVAVTAAGVAVGGAMMKMTNRSHELNEGLRRAAVITGENEEELRDMAIAMSDATFANDDVVAGMERLIQAGVRTKDEFEAMLPVFDDFSDATGKDIVDSIDIFDRMLSALDIPLSEAGEHMDALTYATTQTTVPMNNLAMLMRREAPALKEMGMGVDDVVVAMAALEEQGIRGPRAVMAFQDAIEDADGSMENFWEVLGVTNESLDTHRERLADSEGLTQELADVNNASLGIWADLKARIDDAMWSLGTFMEPVKDLAPLLMGLGPAIKVVSMAKGTMAKAATGAVGAIKGLTVAKLALLGPILLVIGAIAGLVLGIKYLWENNEAFRDFIIGAWEKIKEVGLAVWEGIQEAIAGFIGFFKQAWGDNEEIIHALQETWEHLREMGAEIWEAIRQTIEVVMHAISFIVELTMGNISSFWEEWGEAILIVAETIWEQIKLIVETAINIIKDVILIVLAIIRGDWEEVWERIKSIGETIWEFIQKSIENIFGGIQDFLSEIMARIQDRFADSWGRIRDIFSRAVNWVYDQTINRFQRLHDRATNIFERFGNMIGRVWDGIQRGIRGSVNRIIDTMNGFVRAMNRIGFSAPDWVPVIGGRSWSLNIPQIPRLHTGGIFNAPRPGGEGLALLRDQEVVTTPEQERRKAAIFDLRGLFEGATIYIASNEQAKKLAREIMNIAESKARAEGVVMD